MSCFAIDVASSTGSGDPDDRDAILDRTKIAAYAKLVGALKLEADKDCPKQKCDGPITISGAPLVTDGIRKIKGGKIYVCLVTVSGSLTGKCRSLEFGKPEKKDAADADKPVKALEADGIRAFFAKVAELPRKPARPDGPCRMYRDRKGRGIDYPVCAGSCETGDCRVVVTVNGDRFRAECSCD